MISYGAGFESRIRTGDASVPGPDIVEPNPEAVRHEQAISDAGWSKGDLTETDIYRPVLLRLSLASNLEKQVMSLYGTEWRERGLPLRSKFLNEKFNNFTLTQKLRLPLDKTYSPPDRIRKFLSLPDPKPLVRGTDLNANPAPDPDPDPSLF
jgi:hypothetical protein